MKLFKLLAASGLMIALLSGCVETWQKPGGTQAQLNADEANCLSAATAQYPINLQSQVVPGYYESKNVSPGDIDCDVMCTNNGGGSVNEWVPPTTETIDINATNRTTYKNVCIRQQGWKYDGKDFSPFNSNSFIAK